MKKIILPLLCFVIVQSGICIAQPAKQDDLLVGVFEGRTPCQELAKQLLQSTTPACIKIKWRLKLYKDALQENTGTYELEGFVFRKDKMLTGKWGITKGTPVNPEAIVYQLDRQGQALLFLQKADDNIFFFLDAHKNLMIGNMDFSYTLNRVARKF